MNMAKNFVWPVTDTYAHNVFALKECLNAHAEIFNERGITLFGAGIHGNEFLKLLEMNGHTVVAFIDNNQDKQGGCVNQYPIYSLEQALAQDKKLAILVAVENYGAIREQLIAAGLEEDEDFFCVKTDLYNDYVEEFLRQYSCSILAMGDCALSAVSLADTDYTNLAQMLKNRIGKDNIKTLAMHGMGMGGYYHILRMQIALGMRPKRLLLEVNMETFMSKHHLLPRSQHVGLLQKIYATPGCADNEFQSFIEQSAKRFNMFQSDFFSGAAKAQKNRVSEHSAMLFFKMNYMYSLDTEVEGFLYYLKILDLLKREDIEATIFVPPVNYQYARKLFGDEFTTAYEENLDAIRAKTLDAGFSLLELHYALTPDEFCAVDTPTETSNYVGRDKLCSLLTKALQAEE